MDPSVWFVIAGICFVVFIITFIFSLASYDYGGNIFLVVAVVALFAMFATLIIGGVQASQQYNEYASETAQEQGLTVVDSHYYKKTFYAVTADGSCSIDAQLVDGKYYLIGSNPAIELTPTLLNSICAGGPAR